MLYCFVLDERETGEARHIDYAGYQRIRSWLQRSAILFQYLRVHVNSSPDFKLLIVHIMVSEYLAVDHGAQSSGKGSKSFYLALVSLTTSLV